MDIIEVLKIVEDGVRRNWGDRRICLKLAVETPLNLHQANWMIMGYKAALARHQGPDKANLIKKYTQLTNEALGA